MILFSDFKTFCIQTWLLKHFQWLHLLHHQPCHMYKVSFFPSECLCFSFLTMIACSERLETKSVSLLSYNTDPLKSKSTCKLMLGFFWYCFQLKRWNTNISLNIKNYYYVFIYKSNSDKGIHPEMKMLPSFIFTLTCMGSKHFFFEILFRLPLTSTIWRKKNTFKRHKK